MWPHCSVQDRFSNPDISGEDRNCAETEWQDVVLEIGLEDISARTRRRFQVSGGITLSTLRDQAWPKASLCLVGTRGCTSLDQSDPKAASARLRILFRWSHEQECCESFP